MLVCLEVVLVFFEKMMSEELKHYVLIDSDYVSGGTHNKPCRVLVKCFWCTNGFEWIPSNLTRKLIDYVNVHNF